MTEVIQFRKQPTDEFHEEHARDILYKHRVQILIALLACIAVHLLFFGDYYYTFDDAYVFHVYARNLAQGHGFSFNPGETSHAATPLLTFLLAAQHFLLKDAALMTAKVMNLLFSMGGVTLLFLIAHRISGSSMIALGSALVWATSPLESMLAAGPQDFTLFTFLILLSLYFYLFSPSSPWIYVFLSLVILTRYEGALYAGLLFLNHAYNDFRRDKLRWPILLQRIALMSIAPLLWFGYIGTHSTLLPSSGSAKLNPWALRKIPHFIAGMVIFFFPPLIVAAIAAAIGNIKERAPSLIFLFIWVTFCLFFYGPFLDNRRYYVHLIPFIALFSLIYVKNVAEKHFHSSRLSQIFLLGTLTLSFLAYFAGSNIYYYQQTRGLNRPTAYPAYKTAGLWVRQYTPPDATIALEEIGVIPYFAERKVVDYSGWLDINSKKFREKEEGINPPMLEYLSSKKPDFLIVNTDLVSKLRQQMLAEDSRMKLERRIPVLGTESILIYSCRW